MVRPAHVVAACLLLAAVCASEGKNRPLSCRNTVEGGAAVADDQGRVCTRDVLVAGSGCCPASAPQHVCVEACDAATQCCDGYEACVSCCVSPETASTRSSGLARRRRHMTMYEAIPGTDAFRYCRARCRTSSHSVFHQNRYKREGGLHCYGISLDVEG